MRINGGGCTSLAVVLREEFPWVVIDVITFREDRLYTRFYAAYFSLMTVRPLENVVLITAKCLYSVLEDYWIS
jgi:hypothetical protein